MDWIERWKALWEEESRENPFFASFSTYEEEKEEPALFPAQKEVMQAYSKKKETQDVNGENTQERKDIFSPKEEQKANTFAKSANRIQQVMQTQYIQEKPIHVPAGGTIFRLDNAQTEGQKRQSEAIFLPQDRGDSQNRVPLSVQQADAAEPAWTEKLLEMLAGLQNTEGTQQVSIQIGQVRETADVDKIMETLTKKLWDARNCSGKKRRGR